MLFKSHPNHNPAHVYHFHQVPGAELGEGGSVVDLSHIAPSVLALIQVGTIIKPARKARGPEGPALRALGLLLADGTPTVGGGKTF